MNDYETIRTIIVLKKSYDQLLEIEMKYLNLLNNKYCSSCGHILKKNEFHDLQYNVKLCNDCFIININENLY